MTTLWPAHQAPNQLMQPFVPQRAMAVFAHPDDTEIWCGGTLATWSAAGCRVISVLVTNGDAGIIGDVTREQVAEIRQAEAREAARRLGVEQVVFLGFPDGEVVANLELRRAIVREIRRHRPDTVITSDPECIWRGDGGINHPDHRHTAIATVEAVFPACGQPLIFRELAQEGLTAHKVGRLMIAGASCSNLAVDIAPHFEKKLASLAAHESQQQYMDLARIAREYSRQGSNELTERFRVVDVG